MFALFPVVLCDEDSYIRLTFLSSYIDIMSALIPNIMT